jgi:hemoglobin
MAKQSLYDRIGGVNALSMVVDRFSDEIVRNPKLNVNPALKEWNERDQLPGLKFMRTLWLSEVAADRSSAVVMYLF